MAEREVVDRYFIAMRQGAPAESDLISLFSDNAVYDEPFTELAEAVGIDAIRERFRLGWEQPLPDLELDVLEMEVDGAHARARWECRSSVLPEPVQGEDRYEIVDGKIVRLQVRLI